MQVKILRIINTKIRYKLIFGFVFVSLLTGIVSYFGISTIHDIEHGYGEISTKSLPLLHNLEEMKFACLRLVSSASEYGYIQAEREDVSEDAPLDQENELMKQACNSCHKAFEQYEKLAKESFPEIAEHRIGIINADKILHTSANEFIELKKRGVSGTAALEKKEEMEIGEMEFLKAINSTIDHTNDRLEGEKSQLTSTISSFLRNILVFSGFIFSVSVLIGILMSRSISGPILKLTHAANEFRKGNLDATIDCKSGDEIGTLAHAFNKMAFNLRTSTTELQREKIRFQQLYENVPIGIVLLSKDNEITQVNRAFQSIFKYSTEEIEGKELDTLIVPSERFKEAAILSDETLQAGIVDKETIRKGKDGRLIHVHVFGVPIIINGEVIGSYALYEDITQRKVSQERLSAERNMLRTLVDNIPARIFAKDTRSRFLMNNIAHMRALGATTIDELIGKTDYDYRPKEIADKLFNEEQELIRLGKGFHNQEESIVTRDGRKVWLSVSKVPMLDKNGNVAGLVGISHDITESKHREEELRFQNEIMTNMTEAVYLVRLEDNVIVYANSNFEQMFGYGWNELIGKHVSIINAPTKKSPEEIAKEIRDCIIENSLWSGEVNNIKKDGTSFWCYANVSVFDHSVFGKVFVSFHTDITGRKRAEKLQDAIYRIAKVADISPGLGDLFKNVHAIIQKVMPADNFYFALYDEKENLISTPYIVDEFDPAERPPKPGKGLTEYVIFNSTSLLCDQKLFGEMLARGEVEAVGIPSQIWLGVPLIVNNKTIGMMAAQHYSDVTVYSGREQQIFEFVSAEIARVIEKRMAKEQEVKLMKELESTNKELNDFAYIVSHDLKAPLRAMGSLTNWIANDYSGKFDDQGKEMMDLLVGRVKRMHDLIEGVLRYSRVGRIKEDMVEVSLNDEVKAIIELLSPPENIEIRIENDLPRIVTEPTRIRQVFQNLVSNAIKFTDKPHGLIRIGCGQENGCWKFHVADNGPGIDQKHHEKIFQIFQSLAARDEVESTGIGLTIVKKIVEMNGGQIWLESEIGQGSTFFFTLPLKDK